MHVIATSHTAELLHCTCVFASVSSAVVHCPTAENCRTCINVVINVLRARTYCPTAPASSPAYMSRAMQYCTAALPCSTYVIATIFARMQYYTSTLPGSTCVVTSVTHAMQYYTTALPYITCVVASCHTP